MYAKRLLSCIAAALLAAPALVSAQQTIYKWVDKDGKTVFSDSPPPKDATPPARGPSTPARPPSRTCHTPRRWRWRRNPVTFYTANDCGSFCDRGRTLLSQRGIPYSERNATTDPAAAEAVQKAVGSFIVPVLMVGESALKGFDESTWQSSLDSAGYPRTALPNQPNPRATPPKKAAPPAPPPPAPAEGEAPPEAPAEQPK
jgi:glutaredoxin